MSRHFVWTFLVYDCCLLNARISVLYLFGLLAEFGPFLRMSAAWLVIWQCGQGG